MFASNYHRPSSTTPMATPLLRETTLNNNNITHHHSNVAANLKTPIRNNNTNNFTSNTVFVTPQNNNNNNNNNNYSNNNNNSNKGPSTIRNSNTNFVLASNNNNNIGSNLVAAAPNSSCGRRASLRPQTATVHNHYCNSELAAHNNINNNLTTCVDAASNTPHTAIKATTSSKALQQQYEMQQQQQQQQAGTPAKCLFHNMSEHDYNNSKNLIGYRNRQAACYYTHFDAMPLPLHKLLLPPINRSSSSSAEPVITVVLDLDETLVNNRIPGRESALLRPHVIHFLDYLRTRHIGLELVLWTASTEETARPVLRQLSGDNGVCPFDHAIYRNPLWFTPGAQFHTKDLRLLGRNMDRVVVVDNSAQCVKYNPHNAVLVQDFVAQRPSEDETLVCTGKIITHLHANLLHKGISVANTLRSLAEDAMYCDWHPFFLNEAWGALESMDHIDPIIIPPHGHYIKSQVIFPRNNNSNSQSQQHQQQPVVVTTPVNKSATTTGTVADANRNITVKNRRSQGSVYKFNQNNQQQQQHDDEENNNGDVRCGQDSVERADEEEFNNNNNNKNNSQQENDEADEFVEVVPCGEDDSQHGSVARRH